MSKSVTFKKLAICTITTGLIAASQIATAHTSIQVGTINENTATYNNFVIGHGCEDPATGLTSNPVIAQSVVFPDGVDSKISRSDGVAAGSITEFVTNWVTIDPTKPGTGFGAKIKSTDVFEKEGLKFAEGSSDRIGFYGTDGELPGIGYLGLIPFRTGKVVINPNSCAKSVTFQAVAADICKITKLENLATEAANIWMPAGTGSSYDSFQLDGYGSAPSLKVVRTSALPASCNGVGFDVTVTPSGAQINRDLPIKKANGEQYWPKAHHDSHGHDSHKK
jgi:hypothetical protein